MRYDNPTLQSRLAAEYVIGNLRGAARRRLVSLLQCHAGLRERVAQWEDRLFPLVMHAPAVEPPPRVWRAVQSRIAPAATARSGLSRWWHRLWQTGVAVALAALLYVTVTPPPSFTMVAVLNDAAARPGIVVSWTPQQAARHQLALRIVAHPSMPMNTAWEAWLLAGPGRAPISLGLVTTEETQHLTLSAEAANALRGGAVSIGVSVEAKGGSTSGRPAGPFLFEGPAVKVDL